MQVLVFEDEQVAQLDPVAIGKPAFAIHCGGWRLIDLLAMLDRPISARVRPHLQQMVDADHGPFAPHAATGKTLVVNARMVPSVKAFTQLKELVMHARLGVVKDGSSSIAAAVVDSSLLAGVSTDHQAIAAMVASLPASPNLAELACFEHPHDLLRQHLEIFATNLDNRLATADFQQTSDGVFLAKGASLGPYVTTDTSKGPIVLETGAAVGPYCYLRGPVHLGAGTRVLEHSVLKDGVAAGHTVKIGGEVEASIIEPFTNKQHHGFLGNSYLGSWINLGAGTCNSDLKNTYGTVNMEYRGRKVNTGMQFIGAIIGDYAKTAINTGIFTGKTVGVCSMVYGFVTTNVPSFVNYARLFGQVTEAPVEVMVSTQRRMFARRNVEQRPCDIQLLHDMHALTTHERQALGETLSIEPLSL